MKIFVSYSRKDAGDFAEQIQNDFSSFRGFDIFTDIDKIGIGDVWSNTIETNIDSCDIFLVLVTFDALQSPYVEGEILQAQKKSKKIIPCFYKDVKDNDIKWGLNKIQGITFRNNYELVRNLYNQIKQTNESSSTNIKNVHTKSTIMPSNSNVENLSKGHTLDYKKQTKITSIQKYLVSKSIIGGIVGSAVIIIVIIAAIMPGLHNQPSITPFSQSALAEPNQPQISSTVNNNSTANNTSPIKAGNEYVFTKKLGSNYAEDGQFYSPGGISVDSSGNVYVADTYNNRIQKFDSNGTFITKWGSEGSENGQFDRPEGIAVDSSGKVYVADYGNSRIQKFS